MEIIQIQTSLAEKRIRITDHAYEEAINDRLMMNDVFFSVMQGEIIEDYPTDKPYPSCLILGTTAAGESVHSVWAHNKENGWAVLITVYKPDDKYWIENKRRRK